MIYVRVTGSHTLVTFPDSKAFTAVLAKIFEWHWLHYNNLLERQKLSKNDMYRAYPENDAYGVVEFYRDVIIYDEYNRLLDVRDFRPDPNVDYSKIYNAWAEKKEEEKQQASLAKLQKRQGKRHRKRYGKCRWERKVTKSTIVDLDLYDQDARLRHFNRINNDGGKKPYIYTDCFVKIENNWKNNRKIKRQYMWHKPSHADICKGDFYEFD